MLSVVDKETEEKTVGVRSRKDGDIGQINLQEFINKIQEEIKSYQN